MILKEYNRNNKDTWPRPGSMVVPYVGGNSSCECHPFSPITFKKWNVSHYIIIPESVECAKSAYTTNKNNTKSISILQELIDAWDNCHGYPGTSSDRTKIQQIIEKGRNVLVDDYIKNNTKD